MRDAQLQHANTVSSVSCKGSPCYMSFLHPGGQGTPQKTQLHLHLAATQQ
mgnify:CR=1 FL=1